jgi:carbon monoxide dehydrogenase subunit G
MNFEGSYRLPVPQQQAWDALNDPTILKGAIAGCERFETIGPDAWLAVVRASVGPIGVTFRARLTVSDAQAPHHYTLTGEGQGGAAGHARLRARIELEPEANGAATLLRYSAQAEVGGKIASLGSRLMQSVVRQHTEAFFSALVAQLQPTPQAASPAPEASTSGTATGGESVPEMARESGQTAGGPIAQPAWSAADWHPLAAPVPAWLVVFGTTLGVALGYCLGLLIG